MAPRTRPSKTPLVGFRPVQSKRLYQQIAEQIVDYISSGGLKSGDRLPAERELAIMFGVSRPSVREAMIALEGAGLIEVRTGDGTFVNPPPSGASRLTSSILAGQGPGLLEQFEARRVLEPELCGMAAERIGEAEIAILRAAVDAAEARFAAGQLANDEDYTFHVELAGFSGNRILADVVRELWDLRGAETWSMVRARIAQPEHRVEVIRRRRAIILALAGRNAPAARAEMLALLEWATQRYFGDAPQLG